MMDEGNPPYPRHPRSINPDTDVKTALPFLCNGAAFLRVWGIG